MTTHAQINARRDGTGTLTIGNRTQSVQAENLSAGLAELLAIVVAEAARLEHPVKVIADLEDSPTTGLHVQPDGRVIEDPSILVGLSLLTAPVPAAPHRTARTRRRRRGPVVAGAVVVALLMAAGTSAVLRGGEKSTVATKRAASTAPEPTPTQAVTPVATPTPPTTSVARTRVRVLSSGGRESARFRLVATRPATVQLTTWRRGDLPAQRTRRVRMRAGTPVVVRLQNLAAGQWLWRVRGEQLKPTNGRVQVVAAPVDETTPPAPSPSPSTSPTARPTATPTYTPPPPQPTRSPTPQPTRPAPIKPTGGPVKPDDGPKKP